MIAHRRDGYRDPESQAFIESWFGKLKERLIWRSEFETLDEARAEIGAYLDRYHDRPHATLDYETPKEVRQTWEDAQAELDEIKRPEVSTRPGSRSIASLSGVRFGFFESVFRYPGCRRYRASKEIDDRFARGFLKRLHTAGERA